MISSKFTYKLVPVADGFKVAFKGKHPEYLTLPIRYETEQEATQFMRKCVDDDNWKPEIVGV
jgi:hypothetical protein